MDVFKLCAYVPCRRKSDTSFAKVFGNLDLRKMSDGNDLQGQDYYSLTCVTVGDEALAQRRDMALRAL